MQNKGKLSLLLIIKHQLLLQTAYFFKIWCGQWS